LDEIDKSLQEAAKQKQADKILEKINNSQNLLKNTKSLLGEISKININTGVIGSQIRKIIDALSDKTPFPADHLKAAAESPLPNLLLPSIVSS